MPAGDSVCIVAAPAYLATLLTTRLHFSDYVRDHICYCSSYSARTAALLL